MQYIPFSEIFEQESGKTVNRFYSDVTVRESVYTWYSKDLTFSKRRDEIEKLDSYTFVIVTHLYMIFTPQKGYEGIEYINNNKNDVYNNWFVPMTKSMLKCNLDTSVLHGIIDDHFYRKLYDELVKNHNYFKSHTIKKDKISLIWDVFKAEWNKLLATSRYKKTQIDKSDYLRIYDEINKLL